MIRALIVDDEPLARAGLRARLSREEDFDVVGEAEDGPQAVERIRALAPDVVFLDVQMPGLDGFGVLRQLAAGSIPAIVFVTAHDEHALQAFEIHALDYLLKPFSEPRFQECLRRVREADRSGAAGGESERIRDLLEQLSEAQAALRESGRGGYARRVAVRERGTIALVRVDELLAVEAAGNYVMLVTAERRHLLRLTLTDMERQLDPARFARIHRSTIVQLERVREIRPDPHGDCDVVLDTGAVYRLSRAYRDRLLPEKRPGG